VHGTSNEPLKSIRTLTGYCIPLGTAHPPEALRHFASRSWNRTDRIPSGPAATAYEVIDETRGQPRSSAAVIISGTEKGTASAPNASMAIRKLDRQQPAVLARFQRAVKSAPRGCRARCPVHLAVSFDCKFWTKENVGRFRRGLRPPHSCTANGLTQRSTHWQFRATGSFVVGRGSSGARAIGGLQSGQRRQTYIGDFTNFIRRHGVWHRRSLIAHEELPSIPETARTISSAATVHLLPTDSIGNRGNGY